MRTKESIHNIKDREWNNVIMNILPESYVANSNDLLWAVDSQRKLIFANDAYLDFILKATGNEIHVDDYSISPDGNQAMSDKWDYFYNRALKGEQFHIITNFASQQSAMLVDANFIPLISDDLVLGTACLARATSTMILPSMPSPGEEDNTSFHSHS